MAMAVYATLTFGSSAAGTPAGFHHRLRLKAPIPSVLPRTRKKSHETDPLTCPKCQGEMRIISFIDLPDVIKKILQHLVLWEESHAPPGTDPPACSEFVEPMKEITFDPSYSQMT